jgi:hypothetical protein
MQSFTSDGEPVLIRGRRLRVAVVVATSGAVLAACGGGSSAAGAQSVGSAPVQTSPAPTPSSAPATASAPTTGSGTSFCKYAKAEKSEVANEIKAFSLDSPAQLEKFEEQALSAVSALAASAPAPVKSAVQTVVTTDQTFFKELKAANFDYAKLNTSAIAKINTPAFRSANQTIVNYLRTACGIKGSSSPAA